VPSYIIIGPIIFVILGVISHFLMRPGNTKRKDQTFFQIYRMFLEHTGLPPTDEEYMAFSKLSNKELRKISRSFKK